MMSGGAIFPASSADKPVTGVTPVTEPISCGFDVTPVTAQGPNVTPVTARQEARDGSGNAGSAHEMRVVTPVTPVTPFPGNGGELGLSQRTIAKLAEDYTETTYRLQQEGANIELVALDADLRRRLAEMVLPESVEVEFARVMDQVFCV